jgi:hypothetical protein
MRLRIKHMSYEVWRDHHIGDLLERAAARYAPEADNEMAIFDMWEAWAMSVDHCQDIERMAAEAVRRARG